MTQLANSSLASSLILSLARRQSHRYGILEANVGERLLAQPALQLDSLLVSERARVDAHIYRVQLLETTRYLSRELLIEGDG